MDHSKRIRGSVTIQEKAVNTQKEFAESQPQKKNSKSVNARKNSWTHLLHDFIREAITHKQRI